MREKKEKEGSEKKRREQLKREEKDKEEKEKKGKARDEQRKEREEEEVGVTFLLSFLPSTPTPLPPYKFSQPSLLLFFIYVISTLYHKAAL